MGIARSISEGIVKGVDNFGFGPKCPFCGSLKSTLKSTEINGGYNKTECKTYKCDKCVEWFYKSRTKKSHMLGSWSSWHISRTPCY